MNKNSPVIYFITDLIKIYSKFSKLQKKLGKLSQKFLEKRNKEKSTVWSIIFDNPEDEKNYLLIKTVYSDALAEEIRIRITVLLNLKHRILKTGKKHIKLDKHFYYKYYYNKYLKEYEESIYRKFFIKYPEVIKDYL